MSTLNRTKRQNTFTFLLSDKRIRNAYVHRPSARGNQSHISPAGGLSLFRLHHRFSFLFRRLEMPSPPNDLKNLSSEALAARCKVELPYNTLSCEELVGRYESLVYSLCMRALNNPQDAEEATQDVFLKLFEKINTFEQKSKFKTWLFRVTCNFVATRRHTLRRKSHQQDIAQSGSTTDQQAILRWPRISGQWITKLSYGGGALSFVSLSWFVCQG
jgi:hypothetical protein